MVLVSLVLPFALDVELTEIKGLGRKRACLRTETVVRIVVACDVVSELIFGL